MVAVFSFGGKFSMEPGPGFFVPALRSAFYAGGKRGTKKGGCNDWRENAMTHYKRYRRVFFKGTGTVKKALFYKGWVFFAVL
jgi:hypothetical protein